MILKYTSAFLCNLFSTIQGRGRCRTRKRERRFLMGSGLFVSLNKPTKRKEGEGEPAFVGGVPNTF
ncbi:hypothetical protein CIPAW_01G158000 [Carya illinoinensis]|uniref:Uncharacterized protein n=1 Tax=Carya illinoinensis TaxID=32201 RepID=A0A8T1RLN4_CARIL|nr:hypothetical protein CIPAW_01G158000 [Carya illinoinensis]